MSKAFKGKENHSYRQGVTVTSGCLAMWLDRCLPIWSIEIHIVFPTLPGINKTVPPVCLGYVLLIVNQQCKAKTKNCILYIMGTWISIKGILM